MARSFFAITSVIVDIVVNVRFGVYLVASSVRYAGAKPFRHRQRLTVDCNELDALSNVLTSVIDHVFS